MDVSSIARLLVAIGVLLILLGGVLWISSSFINWGRLPGDLSFRTGSTRIYLPLTTMIVASVILTLLLNLLIRMLR